MATGTKLVYMPPPGRWTPEQQLALTEQHQVTTWRLVPTQAWRLLEHPDVDRYDVSSLRSIVGGGVGVDPRSCSSGWPPAGRTLAPGLVVGLGMTETNGTGATAVMPGLLDAPGNLGGPPPAAEHPGVRAGHRQHRSTTARRARSRSAARRCSSGTTATPPRPQAVLDPDRWYRTGDFGRIEDGLLYLAGRRSDLILRGGENIYPAEIEDRLHAHDDVVDVVVVGVADRVLGEEVKAVVVRRPGSELDADDVRAWAASTLAPFKVPVHVEFRARLPRNAAGKVMKHLLDSADALPFAEE